MSLSKLRGTAKAPAAIFSNSISPEIAAVFSRVQTGAPSRGFAPKKKWKPSRFKCDKPNQNPAKGPVVQSTTKRIIILDEQITYAQPEHSVKHFSVEHKGGFQWQTEMCIAATDACPICSLPKHNPSDKILLTVLDLTPWSYEKEGKKIEKEFTKRELAIGTKQFPIFQALAQTQSGLRGMVLDMTRGNGDLEAGHGVPSFVQKLTEEELLEMFGHDERTNDEGKIIVAANADIAVFDYQKIHTPPTRSELAAKYGVAPIPGSLEERVQEVQNEQAPADDTPPWEDTVNMLDLGELPDVD